MALFDSHYDWYDSFVPGSSLPAFGELTSDLVDWLGFGTDRRNREFNSAQQADAQSFNRSEREAAQDYSSAEAQLNRDWQEHMRDTQYTSAFNQMRDSGINPILAFQSSGASAGSTASAPTSSGIGSSPVGYQASKGSAINILPALVSSYMSAKAAGNGAVKAFWNLARLVK